MPALPHIQGVPLSIADRRNKLVLAVFQELVGEGRAEVRPGDITTRLRERNQPMGYWEVRGALSELEAEGLIQVHAETGAWRSSGIRPQGLSARTANAGWPLARQEKIVFRRSDLQIAIVPT